jgi:nucleoid-associated protein YgaU
MNATIRGLKGLIALAALAGLGLGLRWATAGSVDSASTRDLTSMAVLTVGAVAWVAYAWLLIAVLATVLEQAPGAVGRAASVVAARITSQTSRALLRSALGVAAVTPLTIGVAHATPGNGSNPDLAPLEPPSSVRLTKPISPADWRTTERPSTLRLTTRTATPADWRATEKASTVRLTDEPTRTGRTDQRPGVPAERSARPKPGRVGVPDRPTVGAPTRYTDLRSGHPVRTATRVVQYGDTLWGLAADELGPNASESAVAARWPQWYAANRALIGPDPDLLYPGQVLRIPAPATDQPVPPTHQEK